MAEKIIAIIGCSVLAIIVLPFLIIACRSIGSFFVDIIVDAVNGYINLWKSAIEVIRQVLKGGEDGGRC